MSRENENTLSSRPKQNISSSKKTKKWAIDNVRFYTDMHSGLDESSDIRMNKQRMHRNYSLVLGKISRNDIEKALNPGGFGGKASELPVMDEDIVIAINPSLNTLFGEERKRYSDISAIITNPEAITAREEEKRQYIMKVIATLINPEATKDSEVDGRIKKMKEYLQYDFQSIVERQANQILRDQIKRKRIRQKISEGWKNVHYVGEETYRFVLTDNDVDIVKVNPREFYRYGSSNKIEESEVIREDTYMDIGEIIAEFGHALTRDQVRKLYSDENSAVANSNQVYPIITNAQIYGDYDRKSNDIESNDLMGDCYVTREGEFKVSRVYWKSLRDVYFISRETEFGIEEDILDGTYELQEDETGERKWIIDWWQGVRIGEDIFVDAKRCPLQLRDVNNPYISYPPYIGRVYNIDNYPVRSTVDELIPIQRKWSLFEQKTLLEWSKEFGKLVEIDMNQIPNFGSDAFEGNFETFIGYMKKYSLVLKNSVVDGQYVGGNTRAASLIDAQVTDYINNIIQYMEYLRTLADDIVGVNAQRRGEGMASEGLGVQQERIIRSSHQTEDKFAKHSELITLLLERYLEYVKFSMRNGNKRTDFILDDMTKTLLEVDVDEFTSTDYGVHIMDPVESAQLENDIRTYMQLAVSNGTPLSDIIDIGRTHNISAKVSLLKNSERDRMEQAAKAKEEEVQMQQQLTQLQMQDKEAERQTKILLKQMEIEAELMKKQMEIESGFFNNMMKNDGDTNNNFIDDNVEIEKQRLQNEAKEKDRKSKEKIEKMKLEMDKKIADIKDRTERIKIKSQNKLKNINNK
jgi:hypothetical protein